MLESTSMIFIFINTGINTNQTYKYTKCEFSYTSKIFQTFHILLINRLKEKNEKRYKLRIAIEFNFINIKSILKRFSGKNQITKIDLCRIFILILESF